MIGFWPSGIEHHASVAEDAYARAGGASGGAEVEVLSDSSDAAAPAAPPNGGLGAVGTAWVGSLAGLAPQCGVAPASAGQLPGGPGTLSKDAWAAPRALACGFHLCGDEAEVAATLYELHLLGELLEATAWPLARQAPSAGAGSTVAAAVTAKASPIGHLAPADADSSAAAAAVVKTTALLPPAASRTPAVNGMGCYYAASAAAAAAWQPLSDDSDSDDDDDPHSRSPRILPRAPP